MALTISRFGPAARSSALTGVVALGGGMRSTPRAATAPQDACPARATTDPPGDRAGAIRAMSRANSPGIA
ncbi:hypothetical protein, partial [Rhodosalinus sp. FB01]|uniref:hypothetical protein n=1 Tax=Rhodosalinus sp. FB01 TaxID=3239194 RepID=UPI003526A561